MRVLGGHQFLAAHPEFSPYALGVLFANADVTRLGPGTYAALVRLDGDPVIILNGFHPRQLGFFTAEDTVCAFLHCSSPTDWSRLRADLIGATDPARADAASIRGRLFADPARLRLGDGQLQLQRRAHVGRPAGGSGRAPALLRRRTAG